MKIALIGSRTFTDYDLLKNTVTAYLAENEQTATHIVSGGAKGADTLAEQFALEKQLKMIVFKPDWKQFGKRAGYVRNTDIIENADIVFAFWDGTSRGTKDSIDKAKTLNKQLITIIYKQETCI